MNLFCTQIKHIFLINIKKNGVIDMKNKQYLIKQITTYILAIISIVFLFIIFYQLIFRDLKLNNYPEINLNSNSYLADIKNHSINNTCEIVIAEKNDNHIKNLKSNFPQCKVIEKNKLFEFDLINYLSNLF